MARSSRTTIPGSSTTTPSTVPGTPLVREQMEKSYQLLSAGAATDFVAGKLRGLEAQRVELETTIDEREKARAELDSNRASFQDIKPLLELVQSGGGDEVYKLRSLIA